MDFYAHSSNMIQKTCKETYELDNSSCSYVLVATAASSRRPKQAYPVNFTVDRLNEVTTAVASVDGRMQREIVFVNLAVIHPLGVISLDRSRPSFSRVYSCTQRDVIICLHENGNLSVYARRGLALAMDFYAHSSNMIQKTCKETYELDNSSCSYVLVATAASSRRPKQAYPVNFTVDRLNEVTTAVASVDGRMQFWQLRSIRKSFMENEEQKPVWSLSHLIPHESMENN
uniref:Uncharacterized protein n=1 Tax=Trichobilharzia regenti TaxID=157069 RepID=A0AA85IKM2_TRIRE|nr:unnamed protein product [Trichobilharzia regenti]